MNHHPRCPHPDITYRPCGIKGWQLLACACGAAALQREQHDNQNNNHPERNNTNDH